eukprot:m.28141 g.28141  ORF g.28141 m.28141 type:complete len:1129 (+) comp30578_c0_seq4:23-3409(+)
MSLKRLLLLFAFIASLSLSISFAKRMEVYLNPRAGLQTAHPVSKDRWRRSSTPIPPNSNQVATVFDLPNELSERGYIHWTGNGSQTIFFLTQHIHRSESTASSKLWRSTDYGLTFKDDDQKFDSGAIIDQFYVCPANGAKVVFADVLHSKIYVTVDEGTHFMPYSVSFNPSDITFHPLMEDWMLARDEESEQVYFSIDLGKSWSVLAESLTNVYIYKYYWAVNKVDHSQSLVYFEVSSDQLTVQLYQQDVRKKGSLAQLKGSISTVELVPNTLRVVDEYIFTQAQVGSVKELHRSLNRGSFQRVYFASFHPLSDYEIVDATEHQVFIAIRHYKNLTNIYSSDESGRFLTLCIDNVHIYSRSSNSWATSPPLIGFYKVLGVQGIYIANQATPQSLVKSMISFNKGGKWALMQPTDSAKRTAKCQTNCFAHVHLWYPYNGQNDQGVFSSDNSVGIIMAHGTVGSSLTTEASLLISTNSGLTWDVSFTDSDKDGSGFSFLFGDHGSYMAVGEHYEKITEIKYSCNEGKNWTSVPTSQTKSLVINGMFTEPGETTKYAFAFCSQLSSSGTSVQNWAVVRFNFGLLLSQKCVQSADYYNYTPSYEVTGQECLLGQKTVYERRKPDSCCFNGEQYERQITMKRCSCNLEDFECDYGYTYDAGQSGCVSVGYQLPWSPVEACEEGISYNKSQGYRKVAGDKCVGGDVTALMPVPMHCPDKPPAGLVLDSDISGLATSSGQPVTFSLTQAQGYHKQAKYIFSFGDNSDPVTVIGFDAAAEQQHTFNRSGNYTVIVSVTNDAGSSQASLSLRILDPIDYVAVLPPHAVTVSIPVNFSSQVMGRAEFRDRVSVSVSRLPYLGPLHYLWDFEDGSTSVLSSYQVVMHQFSHPGKHRVTVSAYSPLSTKANHSVVQVFSKVKTMNLGFSGSAETIRPKVSDFNTKFSLALAAKVAKVTGINQNRLEAFVYNRSPLSVDLSVVASTAAEEADVAQIFGKVATAVNGRQISVILEGQTAIWVTSEKEVTVNAIADHTKGSSSSQVNKLAVALSVPAFLLLAAVIGGLVWYCRRYNRLRSAYTVLSQDAMDDDAPLSLGADESDDDQDGEGGPQAIKFSGGRLQIQNADVEDDDNDDDDGMIN